MIKITFRDYEKEYTKNVLYIRPSDKKNFMAYRHNYTENNECIICKDYITKVEKQVKDLTLEEINILEEKGKFNIFDYILNYDGEVELKSYIDTENFEDYIDITEIVKGE